MRSHREPNNRPCHSSCLRADPKPPTPTLPTPSGSEVEKKTNAAKVQPRMMPLDGPGRETRHVKGYSVRTPRADVE
jgi:hypothetical protein